jgi:hypothetical protein
MNEILLKELKIAETNAIKNLARYKFHNFGYWSAIWVHKNKMLGALGYKRLPSPFKSFVELAKEINPGNIN